MDGFKTDNNIILENIIINLKKNTKNRSEKSIKQFKYFLKDFLNYFNVDIKSLYNKEINIEELKENDFNFFIKNKSNSNLYFLCFISKYYLGIEFKPYEELKKYNKRLEIENKLYLKNNIKKEISTPYLTNEELENIYTNISEKDRILFLLLITTGMRHGGFLNCKYENIDFENEIITTIEKGNIETQYMLNPELIFLFKKYNDHVFIEHKSKHRFLKKINYFGTIINRKITPHLFRFTYSRIALNNLNNIKNIQLLLNHSNLITTQLSYIKETRLEKIKRMNLEWQKKDKQIQFPFFMTKEHINNFLE